MTATTLAKANTGVKLYGIVKPAKLKQKPAPTGYASVVEEINAFQHAAPAVNKLDGWAKLLCDRISTSTSIVQKIRHEVFAAHGYLPEVLEKHGGYDQKLEVRTVCDSIYRMSATPKALLADMRTLADDLGFVIIPLQYLSPASGMEAHEIARLVKSFKAGADELQMQVFVLTPVDFYGIEQHAKSANPNLPFYMGKQSAHMMIGRAVASMFRSLYARMGQIENDSAQLAARLGGLEKYAQATQSRVERVESRVLDLERASYRAQREQQRLEADNARLRSEMGELRTSFERMSHLASMIDDPMVFAIKHGESLTDGTGLAYIGPCWGPDFDLAIAQGKVNGAFDPATQSSEWATRIETIWG